MPRKQKSSKRSGASGTGSQADPFVRARWNLTGLYILVLAFVVVFLSSTLYTLHGIQVREQQDRDLEQAPASSNTKTKAVPEPQLEEYFEALGRAIVLLDLGTIALGGALSYWLAGRTLRPIREAVQSEQRLFAGAAHDLRTPLAVMRTEMDVTLRPARVDPDEARTTMVSALEEIDRMSNLVEEMMVLAEGTRKGPGPGQGRQDLTDLVQTAVDRMKTRAASRQIDLSAAPASPVLVAAVPGALDRALVNVLENALKFTPPGGRVVVEVLASRTHADVVVSDTGIGISPGDLPLVTEAFYRADEARSTPGSGLGLAIVRQILADHRGSLELTSVPGKGTRVRLRLPRS